MLGLLIVVGRGLALGLRGHRELVPLGLEKDTPDRRPPSETSMGPIIVTPEVGGLHHRYERRAA
jgi:hypothetical protein